jgi:hypothetical protein
MLFLALTMALAVFTHIGFSNPDNAWAQALKDDRGSGALPAAEPSPDYARPAPEALLTTLKGKRIALLGLSFKPNTDDLREAPSLEIGSALDSLGARVAGYDPVVDKAAAKLTPNIQAVFDPYEALEGEHVAVVVTEWGEIRSLNLQRAGALMEEPKVLVDGRIVLQPREDRAAGMRYRGFGRGYGLGQGRSQVEMGAA